MNALQTLKEKCLNSDRYDPSYEDRLNLELRHIELQELEKYWLALEAKNELVETDRHLVAHLLGLAEHFSLDSDLPLMMDFPDIDVDYSDREAVVEYAKEKYGEDKVAYISNYTDLGALSALRDVKRVLEAPIPREIDQYVDAHHSLNVPLNNASEEVKKAIEIAKALKGNIRQMGITAAGVIISSKPITDYAALWVSKGEVAAVNDIHHAEDIGFVKMDILGVNNINCIQETIKLIEESGGRLPENIWDLDYSDEKIIQEFRSGHTALIFQYGGGSTMDLLKRLKPDNAEDIIATNTLSRPGPDDNAYIRRKFGREKVSYPHPIVEQYLNHTYGLPIYQEQVMEICRHLGGMSWRDVNRVRKMMGKKDTSEAGELSQMFIEGCEKHGMVRKTAQKLWGELEKHGGYSFNRSHAVAYFLIAWANMYFQVYHPFEWILANFMVADNDTKRAKVRSEALRMGLKFKNVHVNHSKVNWSRDGDYLVPGLSSVPGVGESTGRRIVKEVESKGPFTGWNTVITNKKRDTRQYFLYHEDSTDKDKTDIYKVAPLDWFMLPKNAFDALSNAGAIPGVDGDTVHINLASGQTVNVVKDQNIHPYWKPISIGSLEEKPMVVHGYVNNCNKAKDIFRINVQGDVPESFYTFDRIEKGSYVLVVDGKFKFCYMAIPIEDADKHPMMIVDEKYHLGTSKGPGVAYFTNSKKVHNRYVGMILCPQPKVIWTKEQLEEGFYQLSYRPNERVWIPMRRLGK